MKASVVFGGARGGSMAMQPDLVIKQRDSANMCKIKWSRVDYRVHWLCTDGLNGVVLRMRFSKLEREGGQLTCRPEEPTFFELCLFCILWINLQWGLWNYNRLSISQSHLGALSYKLKCWCCEEALGMRRHERVPMWEGYVALTLPAASWWIYFLVGNSFDSSISVFSVCVHPTPSFLSHLASGRREGDMAWKGWARISGGFCPSQLRLIGSSGYH